MKVFMFSIFLMSTSGFAQNIDVASLKNLMTQRQALLESVHPGMSKTVIHVGSFLTESGEECSYTSTATQTILKLQEEEILILSKENFVPSSGPECVSSGAEAYEERILFYEPKPLLVHDLEVLGSSANDIVALTKEADIITMKLNLPFDQEDGSTINELVTVKYDLTKPSFKNIILNEGTGYSITTSDLSDIDPNSIDLSDVLFCENNDGDISECVQGNFSDILF